MSNLGRAFTVRQPAGDNLAVHKAVAEAPPDCVLVVEAVGTDEEVAECALLGDILATAAQHRRIRGLLTNAPIRDGAKLQEMDFPVFCGGRCHCLRHSDATNEI